MVFEKRASKVSKFRKECVAGKVVYLNSSPGWQLLLPSQTFFVNSVSQFLKVDVCNYLNENCLVVVDLVNQFFY